MVEKPMLLVGFRDQNSFGRTSDKKRSLYANTSLHPADAVKTAVSLILVHHPKSDFNTPFILESASADQVCPDAVSTAKFYKKDF
ncbi:hypothetical protein [Microcoleus sp.]|uniref:hypothetical protein n=1 Tax=Microcoleus sp. TaxID=44472 RepID=UPI00403EC508